MTSLLVQRLVPLPPKTSSPVKLVSVEPLGTLIPQPSNKLLLTLLPTITPIIESVTLKVTFTVLPQKPFIGFYN